MKKYEYVKVHMEGIFSAELEEHRDGKLKDLDLIFETDC